MPTRADIVASATAWLGTPYRHQASLKGVGCDCLGLVRGVWRDLYGSEPQVAPAYSADWAEAGGSETLAEAARRHLTEIPYTEVRAGDVLLFRWKPYLPAKHAGIAVAPDRLIHAQDGAVVSEIVLSRWWLSRRAFAFAFPGVTD
jgi:NlpC/P60 family putative phage cell wall peptidase